MLVRARLLYPRQTDLKVVTVNMFFLLQYGPRTKLGDRPHLPDRDIEKSTIVMLNVGENPAL